MTRIHFHLANVLLLMLALAGNAWADRSFTLTVDTSSLAGTSGSFEFQLNAGPGTYDPGAVTIEFVGLTQHANPGISGDVRFNPAFTIGNGQPFNSFFAGASFGSTMTIRLRFTGIMVDNPTPGRTAGTDFTFSIYSDVSGSKSALTNAAAGNALFQISFDPAAGIVVANNSASAQLTQSMSVLPRLSVR